MRRRQAVAYATKTCSRSQSSLSPPLWPDDSDDSDYVPSSEESDDHTYEERNGIDTQAMK